MKQVMHNLYIGNSQDVNSDSLMRHKIDAVVNVAFDLNDPYSSDFQWYKVGLIDGEGNKLHQIKIAVKTVWNLLAKDQRVLLHCHEGKSRSVYIAYLVLFNIINNPGINNTKENRESAAKVIDSLDTLLPGHKLNKLLDIYGKVLI